MKRWYIHTNMSLMLSGQLRAACLPYPLVGVHAHAGCPKVHVPWANSSGLIFKMSRGGVHCCFGACFVAACAAPVLLGPGPAAAEHTSLGHREAQAGWEVRTPALRVLPLEPTLVVANIVDLSKYIGLFGYVPGLLGPAYTAIARNTLVQLVQVALPITVYLKA